MLFVILASNLPISSGAGEVLLFISLRSMDSNTTPPSTTISLPPSLHQHGCLTRRFSDTTLPQTLVLYIQHALQRGGQLCEEYPSNWEQQHKRLPGKIWSLLDLIWNITTLTSGSPRLKFPLETMHRRSFRGITNSAASLQQTSRPAEIKEITKWCKSCFTHTFPHNTVPTSSVQVVPCSFPEPDCFILPQHTLLSSFYLWCSVLKIRIPTMPCVGNILLKATGATKIRYDFLYPNRNGDAINCFSPKCFTIVK